MTETNGINMDSIFGIILLISIAAIIYGPWRWVCTDIARQLIFERRDAIFDMARAGKLRFGSREYAIIRKSLQTTIRFSHDLTVTRLVYFYFRCKLYQENRKPELFEALDCLQDEETRLEVQRHVYGALNAGVVLSLLKTPFVALLVIVPALIVAAIPVCFQKGKTIFFDVTHIMLSEAESTDNYRVA